MSGIYISGMEMPKDGAMIVAIRPDGKVEDVMGCYVGEVISVPDHGRLIDADACERIDIRPWDAPTIIPADPAEEPMRCNPCNPTQPECGSCEWAEDGDTGDDELRKLEESITDVYKILAEEVET